MEDRIQALEAQVRVMQVALDALIDYHPNATAVTGAIRDKLQKLGDAKEPDWPPRRDGWLPRG